MPKEFNVTAVCMPEVHYMVNIDERLRKVKAMVDAGKYFTINRARQYGKTTTLMALENYLQGDYYVVSMDFQTMSNENFKNEKTFSTAFAKSFLRILKRQGLESHENVKEAAALLQENINDKDGDFTLQELFENLSDICAAAGKPVVLMIDEVDSATNNQVFLDFLAQLRAGYIRRAAQPAFWSVILAGVYDVKNLKRKIRPESEHKVNSPWNIAADFDVDMSLSKEGIAGMLEEYEADYHTGMDIDEMAGRLYDETSGYPFLVSRLCQLMDEKVSKEKRGKSEAWTLDGFEEAEKMLLSEKNTLFESLIGKVINYPELDKMLREHIFNGKGTAYVASNPMIDLAAMFGIIKKANGLAVPANRIFDTLLSDYYLSMSEMTDVEICAAALEDKNRFIDDGRLNMRLVMERFVEHFTDLYGHLGEKFIEEEGRKYFLLYLKPIINGTGNYSMEAVTRSQSRTDLMVYYGGRKDFN